MPNCPGRKHGVGRSLAVDRSRLAKCQISKKGVLRCLVWVKRQLDIAREEVTDGGNDGEGASKPAVGMTGGGARGKPKTGFYSLPTAATATVSFPHPNRKKKSGTLSALPGSALNENALPYRPTQEPDVPRCSPLYPHQTARMPNLACSQCHAVESIPGKISGAWILSVAPMPVYWIRRNRREPDLR